MPSSFTIEVSFSVVVSAVLPSITFIGVILSGPALAAKDLPLPPASPPTGSADRSRKRKL
jgi:hypothetical protein